MLIQIGSAAYADLKEGDKIVSNIDPLGRGLGYNHEGIIVTFHKYVDDSRNWIQIKEFLNFPIYSEHSIDAGSFDVFNHNKHKEAVPITDEWIINRHRRRLASVGGGEDVGVSENI